jgi:putative DNA primase/helicase
LDFDYDPTATAPRFQKFLTELWPEDPESITLLQQLFGYALTPDTRFQKIFLMIGPTRRGKGTIARLLRALNGERNTCNPTLSQLSQNFGR